MGDFLKAAKQTATEILDVAGMKVHVRGLSIKELSRITKQYEKDPEALTMELMAACCYDEKGKHLIPADRKDELQDISPLAFKSLSEAVARVNGFLPGNSSATVGADSSSD